MWYNVDFNKWVEQLTPPVLRSKVLLALLKVLVLPVFLLHQSFLRRKRQAQARLNTTPQVASLEAYLCQTFFLEHREVYIEEVENSQRLYLYFQREDKTAHFLNEQFVVRAKMEEPNKVNFLVFVPTFLCTSLDKQEDKYNGEFLTKIINIINTYKPAGRIYQINLYQV